MKRILIIGVLISWFAALPLQKTAAQDPISEIIKAGIKKVIKAIDLKIQRLQNNNIWLQNAQKTLENKMQKLKLNEISGWVEKQRKLYAQYYEELWRVKAALSYYHKIKDIIQSQVQLVGEYRQARSLFRQDRHFSADEIAYMETVYGGILEASVKNLDELYLVINSFATQMTDAKRLELINKAETSIDQNLADLRQFNSQNINLSLQRAKDLGEIETVKTLYGLK